MCNIQPGTKMNPPDQSFEAIIQLDFTQILRNAFKVH